MCKTPLWKTRFKLSTVNQHEKHSQLVLAYYVTTLLATMAQFVIFRTGILSKRDMALHRKPKAPTPLPVEELSVKKNPIHSLNA